MPDTLTTMVEAFEELTGEDGSLYDPDMHGHVGAAVHVSLDRQTHGEIELNVRLHQIVGGQLADVLAVARKYELEVREENGWLVLGRHLVESDREPEPEPEPAEATS